MDYLTNGIAVHTNLYNDSVLSAGQPADTGDSFAGILNSVMQTTDLDSVFEKASQTYQVPVNLLKAVAKAESNFNPNAVSSAGAQGVMQLMPGTARGLGVTDPLNAEQNIMGGAKYLSQLLRQFDGDTTLAVAAYNAGPGNVKKYGGVPPFQETKNYVKKVLGTSGSEITAGSVTSTPTQASQALGSDASDVLESLYGLSATDASTAENYLLMKMKLYQYQATQNLFSDISSFSDTDSTLDSIF